MKLIAQWVWVCKDFFVYLGVKTKKLFFMKTDYFTEKSVGEDSWQVRPYSKSELAQAYAPDIAPTSALNRLAQWIKLNRPLSEALHETGYYARQHVFTSKQVELIFHYLGRP